MAKKNVEDIQQDIDLQIIDIEEHNRTVERLNALMESDKTLQETYDNLVAEYNNLNTMYESVFKTNEELTNMIVQYKAEIEKLTPKDEVPLSPSERDQINANIKELAAERNELKARLLKYERPQQPLYHPVPGQRYAQPSSMYGTI